MPNVRTDQAPARSETGLAAVGTLIAVLVVALVAAPGLAWAGGADLAQPALAPAPVASNSPAKDAASGASSPSRWARLSLWQKVLGAGATLAGLAAVGSGAYLLWLDGQDACSPPGHQCRYRHQTALSGWLLVAGGAAASLGGVTLLLVPPIGESHSHAITGLALSARF
jgi:hypothetical protein